MKIVPYFPGFPLPLVGLTIAKKRLIETMFIHLTSSLPPQNPMHIIIMIIMIIMQRIGIHVIQRYLMLVAGLRGLEPGTSVAHLLDIYCATYQYYRNLRRSDTTRRSTLPLFPVIKSNAICLSLANNQQYPLAPR